MNTITFKQILYFILIISSTFLVYTNLILYQSKITGIPTYYILFVIFVLFILFRVLKGDYIIRFNNLSIWIIYYFILLTVYFVLSEPTEEMFVIYRQLILAIIFMMVMLSLYLYDKGLILTQKVIFYSVLLSTMTIIMDFFTPGIFAEAYNLYFIKGRAAALFLNPNTAGTGLIIGLIFSIDVVKKEWRFLYLAFVFIGVLVTFSRASILSYVLILTVLTIQKKIELSKVLIMVATATIFISSFLTFGIDYLEDQGVKTKDIKNRIVFLNVEGEEKAEKDESRKIREYVLFKALNMFANHPVFGNGFASTTLWDWPESTHNLYVLHWANYGLFGMVLIPLLMFILLYKSQGNAKTTIWLFIFVFMFRSMFSHNTLDIYYLITSISLAMAMNIQSQKGYLK